MFSNPKMMEKGAVFATQQFGKTILYFVVKRQQGLRSAYEF